MTSAAHRLRKYRRKKQRAKDPAMFNRLARLYWRYHHQVYGPVKSLWEHDAP
jgi:ABC-type uncharacterized transport system YnjBCD substrate-binding protein